MKLTELIDYVDRIPSSTLLVSLIILGVVIGWFLSNRKDIKGLWDSWYQTRKRKDELLNMLLSDHDRICAYEDNRKHDREQSFEIQKQLIDANTQLATQLTELSRMMQENQRKTDQRFAESEERNQKRIRAELKDKIMRAYRLHHKTKKITAMELDALEGLVEEQFAVNGNSFVQNIVQPEIYTWSVVDEFEE